MRRAGWWHAGVRDPESVAEHSLRAAQLAGLLAAEEGADPARAAYLALWHDIQEARTGDLPRAARPYVTKPDARAITADQTATLPTNSAESVRDAVDEYESATSLEARCARDADKLEMLLQAVEYASTGITQVDEWMATARKSLSTDTARRIAEVAPDTPPLSWRNY
ncbi:HD domain-containing protein [Haloechinothrix sp. LS1_15]|nr:HD domain-containing protein [Haloechinothrix sp. LS1_15]